MKTLRWIWRSLILDTELISTWIPATSSRERWRVSFTNQHLLLHLLILSLNPRLVIHSDSELDLFKPELIKPTRYPEPIKPTRYPEPIKPTRYPEPINLTRYPEPIKLTRQPELIKPTRYPELIKPTRYSDLTRPIFGANEQKNPELIKPTRFPELSNQ